MLPSQRALFDIPRDVCYLNAAASARCRARCRRRADAGVARKAQPWAIEPGIRQPQFERARAAAARLINADAGDVALISSVSYGIATAGKVLTVPAGSRVLLLQDDHSSPVLEWMTRADARASSSRSVPRPDDGDWTAALLVAAIERRGRAAGCDRVDLLGALGGRRRRRSRPDRRRAAGARCALLVDATHGAGVMHIDVRTLDPDFLMFPTYKWLLGPYGRAFLYVAKR